MVSLYVTYYAITKLFFFIDHLLLSFIFFSYICIIIEICCSVVKMVFS